MRDSLALSIAVFSSVVAVVRFAVAQDVSAASGSTASADSPGIVFQRDVAYGPLPQQTLTTCRPEDGKLHAGVVLIHGGGWVAYDKTDLLPVCEALARDGLFAATINYRLVDKTVPAANTHWPAQLADVQLAVRWLRANAASVGLDRTRLCAYGESAGGHLAVFLAVKKTIEPTDMAAYLPDEPVSVICAVDNFGPVDLTDVGLKNLAQGLIGKPMHPENMAMFLSASPLFLVDRETAPVYIEQGSGDEVVLPSQSFKLFDALTRNNVSARFTTYSGGHGWQNVPLPEQKFLAQEERQFLRLFLIDAARDTPSR